MTVPEENRAKTATTDDTHVLENRTVNREANESRPPGATGRTMREAMEEARVRPDDFGEE